MVPVHEKSGMSARVEPRARRHPRGAARVLRAALALVLLLPLAAWPQREAAAQTTAGVTINESGGSTSVPENGTATDSFTVELNTQPTHDVRVFMLTTANSTVKRPGFIGSNLNLEVFEFTPSNWNIAQTLTLQGVDDSIDNPGDQRTAEILVYNRSDDPAYDVRKLVGSVTVTVVDDDDPPTGIALSASPASISESATGSARSVTVTATVQGATRFGTSQTVSVSAAKTSGSVGVAGIADFDVVIDAGARSGAASVVVAPQDDAVDEADAVVTFTGSLPGATVTSAALRVVDDDEPPTLTVAADTSPVTEGTAASFTISASPAAASPVPVAYTVTQDGAFVASGSLGPQSVTLSGASVTVTVPTVADRVDEANGSVTVTLDPGSDYTVGTPGHATAAVSDDDEAGVSLSESSGTTSVPEDGSAADSWTVVLDSQPTRTVTVAVSAASGARIDGPDSAQTFTASETLTFSPTDWNSAQTVRVRGVDDSIDNPDNARSVTVTHSVSSNDPLYGALADKTVTVTVTDDDGTAAEPVLSVTGGGAVTEGSAASFAIRAWPAAPDPLTVQYTVTGQGGFIAPGELGPQTVTLSGIGGALSIPTLVVAGSATGSVTVSLTPGVGYAVGKPASATVTVADTDPGGVVEPGGATGSGGGGSGGGPAAPTRERSDVVVIVADGWNPADVAVASVLSAATADSAVLYTHRERLPSEAREVLDEVLPRKVIVVGGPAAVGTDAITAIRDSGDLSVIERVAGADRYGTAAAAARSVLGAPGGDAVTVVLANGHSPPDVGAAAAIAARTPDAAVLYTAADGLPDATAAVLREYRPERAVLVGGPTAVPADVDAAVREAAPGAEVVRVAGDTRFATAAAAAQHVLGDPRPDRNLTVVIANGHSPADIGAAVALAARTADSAVVYTATDGLSGPTARLLADYRPTRIAIVGGVAAISDGAEREAAQAALGAAVERFTGDTRTHTAAVIARRILGVP